MCELFSPSRRRRTLPRGRTSPLLTAAALSLVAACLPFVTTAAARAQSPGYIIDFGNSGVSYYSGVYTLGNVFQVGPQDVTVSALGYFDDGDDGLSESHDVGLYDSSGSLIAGSTVTVPTGTGATLIGDYRYVDLSSPITLSANTQYTVAGTTNGADGYAYAPPNAVTNDNRIGYLTSGFNSSATLTALDANAAGVAAYAGANLLLTGSPYTQVTVQNAGFEDNAAQFQSPPGYVGQTGGPAPNPEIANWSSSGYTGVDGPGTGSGEAFDNNGDGTPEGNAAAFLQAQSDIPATITQTISGFTAGHTYAVTFYDNYRENYDDPTLSVSLGGTQVFSSAIPYTDAGGYHDYNFVTTDTFTAASSDALDLVFGAVDNDTSGPSSGGDATALIDNVKVLDITSGSASAPEPGACPLMAAAGLPFAGLLLLRRRRNGRAASAVAA